MNQTQPAVFDRLKEKQKLSIIAQVADEPLVKIESVWPFQFFPSSIVVDRNKVNIVHGLFFFSKNVISVLIKDIRTINMTTGLLFSSLRFDIKGYEENPQQINFLPKKEATDVHRLIIGLIAAKSQQINIEKLTNQDIYDKALQIGTQQVELDSAL